MGLRNGTISAKKEMVKGKDRHFKVKYLRWMVIELVGPWQLLYVSYNSMLKVKVKPLAQQRMVITFTVLTLSNCPGLLQRAIEILCVSLVMVGEPPNTADRVWERTGQPGVSRMSACRDQSKRRNDGKYDTKWTEKKYGGQLCYKTFHNKRYELNLFYVPTSCMPHYLAPHWWGRAI